mmetsp:Transcript_11104/g.16200  ORF Transcript_11104/g.16200 Transcript_11104/m.16200 type:complete len:254 (-) Transcript_11104:612-1373(-)
MERIPTFQRLFSARVLIPFTQQRNAASYTNDRISSSRPPAEPLLPLEASSPSCWREEAGYSESSRSSSSSSSSKSPSSSYGSPYGLSFFGAGFLSSTSSSSSSLYSSSYSSTALSYALSLSSPSLVFAVTSGPNSADSPSSRTCESGFLIDSNAGASSSSSSPNISLYLRSASCCLSDCSSVMPSFIDPRRCPLNSFGSRSILTKLVLNTEMAANSQNMAAAIARPVPVPNPQDALDTYLVISSDVAYLKKSG